MSASDTKGTTAAPNSTTGASEVVAVPATEMEKASEPLAEDSTRVEPNAAAVPTETTTEVPAATDSAESEQKQDVQSDATPSVAEAPEPATAEKQDEAPAPAVESPIQQLWSLAKSKNHPEIWGVELADPQSHVPSQIVFQKYLNANDGDLSKAQDQLTKTLDWRATTKPLELLKKKYSKVKFEGLGFVTTYGDKDSDDAELKEVFTWNIYGSAKNIEETFGVLDEFLDWRVALMEEALQALSIDKATKPITATEDPYKITQVHDYKSISFFRQSASVKSASTKTIQVFGQNYPELLKEKFFVNVPAVMGFIYTFMKLFVAPKTIKKFHPMSNGGGLAQEFGSSRVKGLGEMLPKEYGGKGEDLKSIGKEPELE